MKIALIILKPIRNRDLLHPSQNKSNKHMKTFIHVKKRKKNNRLAFTPKKDLFFMENLNLRLSKKEVRAIRIANPLRK